MPAFRILYLRSGATAPETITAGFDDLEQAMNVFAARGLRIIYIAEQRPRGHALAQAVGKAMQKADQPPCGRSSFPIRRFTARAVA